MISAFGVDHGVTTFSKAFSAEQSRHRRQRGYQAAAGGGAAVTGVSAVRQQRTARALGRQSIDQRKQGERSLRVAGKASDLVAQRISRHATTGKGTLPPTRSNLAGTARAHSQSAAHVNAGIKSYADSTNTARSARKASRRAHGKAGVAVALAGTAVGIGRHDRRGGRSYSYR